MLSQLNLEPAFAGAGVLRKDVEDQRCAVEHLDVELALEVPLLRGRQLIIEDHGRIVELEPLRGDLYHLPLAYVSGGVAAIKPLHRLADDPRPRCVRKQCQLLERALSVPAPADAVRPAPVRAPVLELRGHQERPLLRLSGRMQLSSAYAVPPNEFHISV